MADDSISITSENSFIEVSESRDAEVVSIGSDKHPVHPIPSIETTDSKNTNTTKDSLTSLIPDSSSSKHPGPSSNPPSPTITSQTIYSYPGLSAMEECLKIIPFVNEPLETGSVIFSFPRDLFKNRAIVYQLIEEQLGPVVSDAFLPISEYYTRKITDKLIVNTRFSHTKVTEDAINKGIIIDGIQYKAILCHRDVQKLSGCIELKLAYMCPTKNNDRLISDIHRDMRGHGDVMKVDKLFINNYFEGQVKVTLKKILILGKFTLVMIQTCGVTCLKISSTKKLLECIFRL